MKVQNKEIVEKVRKLEILQEQLQKKTIKIRIHVVKPHCEQ